MNYMMQIIVAILALTVLAPSYASQVNTRDLDCLAKNIYYEAGSESLEGKVAVGIVTLNRVNDGRFSSTICGVVNQRTEFQHSKTVTVTREVTHHVIFTKQVEETTTRFYKTAVCQFSWSCTKNIKPKESDQRWIESRTVAEQLLQGGYNEFQDKYQEALYFHASTIRPAWRNLKKQVARIGNHIFYAEK
jgi:N-acetylmuramoyl-L-alanine amidase